jgi:glycosyltransferase involved in cell wall biosynthesis
MSAPAVSLVVTTYQLPEHLRRVLASVQQQTVADRLEVIVSDDGSADHTRDVVDEFAAQAPFPVKWVSLPHDGFQLSRTRNQGVLHAKAPHVVFLDGDCLIEPDHVEQHLRLWRPGHVTNTYCVRLDQPTSERITVANVKSGEFLRWVPSAELRGLFITQLKAWFYRSIGHRSKPALRGGNMGIAREDYLRVNGYDERFKAWGKEDDDLGLRLRALGFKVDYILHKTRTYHLWHPPASTKCNKFNEGENFTYLTRKVRLTKCLDGLTARSASELTIRLNGRAAEHAVVAGWLQATGLRAIKSGTEHADLELALASDARFTRHCDCRVIMVDGDTGGLSRGCKQADVVLSRDGSLGNDKQLRLRLAEVASFYAALGFANPLGEMAARQPQLRRRSAA